uniref:Thyroglobulin type-1 domain-containing protein n=1 Tax=Oryzias latipes TaxID=8090 RepID=A0A3B3I1X1_ORYLA
MHGCLCSGFRKLSRPSATSGRFSRWFPLIVFVRTAKAESPSPCEEERRAALETSSVFVPTCERGGSYSFTQCQQGGQCWCVDPSGREVPGTRQLGGPLACGEKNHPLIANMAAGLQRRQCGPDGSFAPLQCDVTSCWCVTEYGQEVVGTRTPQLTGVTPSKMIRRRGHVT